MQCPSRRLSLSRYTDAMGVKVAAFIAAGVLLSTAGARADCGPPRPPCEALAQSSVVALVDVIDAVGPFEAPNTFGRLLPHVARLRVAERFKGIPAEQREVTATIDYNAETIPLEAGKRFLVYAHIMKTGHWLTACSRTKRVSADDEELKQLRRCGGK